MRFQIETVAGCRRMIATDAAGDRGIVTLRGFNISGNCKLDGLPCRSTAVAEAVFSRIAEDGFNLVRLPVIWEKLCASVEQRLVEFVEAAARHGLFVLIDLHQDILGSVFRHPSDPERHGTGFPREILEAAYAATSPDTPWREHEWHAPFTWQQNYRDNHQLKRCLQGLGSVLRDVKAHASHVAALFEPQQNVIGYDVINEPMPPLTDDAYHSFFNELASALPSGKAVAMPRADWLYRYTGPFPFFVDHASEIQPGFNPSRLSGLQLSTPHIYAPIEMAGLPFPKPPSHIVRFVDEWHQRHDLPFIVGEFGVPARLIGARRHLARWVSQFEQHSMSWCLWHLNPEAGPDGNDHWCGEHMSVASHDTNDIDKTVFSARYDALVRPFIALASGDVSGLTYDARAGKFRVTVGKTEAIGFKTKLVISPALGDFEVTTFEGGSRFCQTDRTVTFSTDDGAVTIELTRRKSSQTRIDQHVRVGDDDAE